MRIYNSLSRQVEEFTARGPEVTVYACGITPYASTHLGHVFTYATVDTLVRHLERLGYRVRYAQNITDIDDPILRESKRAGEGWRDLGRLWTARFIREMEWLNVRPPDEYVQATEVIPDMQERIRGLVKRGFAYASGGSVYLDASARPELGALSRVPRESMLSLANEQGNRPDDPRKRDPLDFALWRAQEEQDEPWWESPWGRGRPGWHIGCATIAETRLGLPVDIHLGGSDLIFPHHEAEVAIAESVSRAAPFVRYWVHAGMVRLGGEKMSKSKGNLVMAADLLERFSADALRLYMARHHYRVPWDHDPDDLARAEESAGAIRGAIELESPGGALSAVDPAPYRASLAMCLDEDLDSPGAVRAVEELAHAILGGSAEGKGVAAAQGVLREMAGLLGLRREAAAADPEVREGWRRHAERLELSLA